MMQACIYLFSLSQWKEFATPPEKTPLESSEGNQVLRLLEWGQPLQMFLTQSASLAVDAPHAVAVVEAAMLNPDFRACEANRGKGSRNWGSNSPAVFGPNETRKCGHVSRLTAVLFHQRTLATPRPRRFTVDRRTPP